MINNYFIGQGSNRAVSKKDVVFMDEGTVAGVIDCIKQAMILIPWCFHMGSLFPCHNGLNGVS